MGTVFTILIYLAIMIVLVLVHELGHFLSARAFGVGVEEFGVGFPPRIWGKKRGETTYSINAIPLGGFVKLAGEEDPKVNRSLAGKSKGVRALVLSAGAIMNLILPLVLLSIAFMVPHTVVTEPLVVQSVDAGSPAELGGFQAGDVLLMVNGHAVQNTTEVDRYVQLDLGSKMTFTVQHVDGSIAEIAAVPRWNPPSGQGAVGIHYNADAILADRVVSKGSEPFWRAIPMGFTDCVQTFRLFYNGILSMIKGATPVVFLGPVGVAQITGEVARAGISPLLEFAAIFSISIGIFNLFPLPALDGGRIFFVFLEWIRRGKRVSPKTESMVHLAGFALLMILILFITYQDVLRLILGQSVIQ